MPFNPFPAILPAHLAEVKLCPRQCRSRGRARCRLMTAIVVEDGCPECSHRGKNPIAAQLSAKTFDLSDPYHSDQDASGTPWQGSFDSVLTPKTPLKGLFAAERNGISKQGISET